MNKNLAFAIVAMGTAVLMSGCAGYRLGGVKPSRYSEIQRIAIPTFKNETLEPRAGVLVANTVIKQFQADGTYKITSRENADAILEVTIKEVQRHQLRAADINQLRSTELELILKTEYRFIDADTGKDLEEGRMLGKTNFFVDRSFQVAERQALPYAAEDLARQMVSKLSEGW